MKRPAVFFDRDNTLIVSDGYLGDPAKVELIPGAAEAVARARGLGFAVVIFSNQSGVARGMFTEEDVQAVNSRLDELLRAENPGAVVDRHEYCPFHPEGTIDVYARESDRRKPKPGMIHYAADKMALDLAKSWVIGDAARDIEAGKAAGMRCILFSDPNVKKSPAAEREPRIDPDYTVSTLVEALDYIEKSRDGAVTAPAATVEAAPLAPAAAPTQNAPAAPVATSSTPAPAATTEKRQPKVVIGSKYVPPAGKAATSVASAAEPTETPAARKTVARTETRSETGDRPAAPPPTGMERVESLLEQIFLELRRRDEQRDGDFSVSKLLAGVVQIIVLAILFLAYLRRNEGALEIHLLLAMVLQTLTIALLIMSRQK